MNEYEGVAAENCAFLASILDVDEALVSRSGRFIPLPLGFKGI
jgi:hypothetical protein